MTNVSSFNELEMKKREGRAANAVICREFCEPIQPFGNAKLIQESMPKQNASGKKKFCELSCGRSLVDKAFESKLPRDGT